MTNSRLKDYLDLSVVLEREVLDSDMLASAIAATFNRRGTTIPASLPVGLTDEFANDPSRQALWQAFHRKNAMTPRPLADVVVLLSEWLQSPPLKAAISLTDKRRNLSKRRLGPMHVEPDQRTAAATSSRSSPITVA